jgi:cardiolipin synthase (CMP-forming)
MGAGDRVLTVPNALSLLRLGMVPVVVLQLLGGEDMLAAAFFALASATDFLDGRIARRMGPTRLGRILDPLADRVMLSSVAVVLAIRGLLPEWAVALLVLRDTLALLGSLVAGGKVRVNRVGKAATAVLMGAVVIVVVVPGLVVGKVMFYVGFALSIAAGLMYLRHVRRILGGG